MPVRFTPETTPSAAPKSSVRFTPDEPEAAPGIARQVGAAILHTPETVSDVAVGAAKGLYRSAAGVVRLGSKLIGQDVGDPPEWSQPTNTAQKVGVAAENVAEFFAPAGAIGRGAKVVEAASAGWKLSKAARIVMNVGARAGMEAGAAGAITAAQTGGDAEKIKTNAAVAGALPIAGAVLSPSVVATKRWLKGYLAPRIIDSLIKASRKLKEFGREPGREVAEQGITGNTLPDLAENIATKRNFVGENIDRTLKMPAHSGKRLDIEAAVVGPIDAAIQAELTTEGREAVITRLEKMKQALLGPRTHPLSPLDVRKLKTQIGDRMKWSEDPVEGTANAVKQKIYSNLKNLVDEAVPAVREQNKTYSNLLAAEHATFARADAAQNLSALGLTDGAMTVLGGVTGLLSHGSAEADIIGALSGLAVSKAAKSTAVLSRLAAQFAKLSPDEKTILTTKAIPLIRNLYMARPWSQ